MVGVYDRLGEGEEESLQERCSRVQKYRGSNNGILYHSSIGFTKCVAACCSALRCCEW